MLPTKPAGRPAGPAACLVVVYGSEIGRRYPLDRADMTVGRSQNCDVVLDQESVSRQHARIRFSAQGNSLEDLGSTNGSYVNQELAAGERTLQTGDLIKIGRTVLRYLCGPQLERRYHAEIARISTTDGLTQVFNRKHLDDQLARELSRSARYGRPFSLVLSDVDHFHQLNQDYGHLAGDAVLAQLAAGLSGHIRPSDLLARVDEDTFAFLLPETPLAPARLFAEKIRALVETRTFPFEGALLKCTLSVGISSVEGPAAPTADLVLRVAEENVRVSKRRGRNCVAG
jgi:diguanylate cyclase (GGDEF)-like protein